VKREGRTEQNREQFAISFLLFLFWIIRIRGAVNVWPFRVAGQAVLDWTGLRSYDCKVRVTLNDF
jgi:hypothetical protein